MGTSDIALEKVQALLKIDTGSGSLHNHIVRVVRSLASDKPQDALAQLETLSRHLKQSSFRGTLAPDEDLDIVTDAAAEQKRQQWCTDALQLVRPPSDPTATPKVLASVQNFLADSAMFEWAGVGFGEQESFHIAMSLRKLASQTPALEQLRLWGKMLGTGADYYVAEGRLQSAGAAPPAPPLPGTPEYDVEPRGEGANSCTYWVSAGGSAPWTQLPAARASHIVAARQTKRLLTGDLGAPVCSMPWFPGMERHLLRAQIARITAACTLAARGFYEADEESDPPVKNKIKETEGFEFPSHEDLAAKSGSGWVHCAPFLLNTSGRSTWPDASALGLDPEDPAAVEIERLVATEEEHGMLESIEEDLADLKPVSEEDPERSPAWSIKTYGDTALYGLEEQKSHCAIAVKSLVWPGAVTVAQGSKFSNLYIGYGLKCGTLVPPNQESGLPLARTSPFWPLAPDDIMEEPADIEEKEEPNPQEEPGSDGQDEFDEEEEES